MVVVLALFVALAARAEGELSPLRRWTAFSEKPPEEEVPSPLQRRPAVLTVDRTRVFEVARAAWEEKQDIDEVRLAEVLAKAHSVLGPKRGWWTRFWHMPWATESEKDALGQAREALERAVRLMKAIQPRTDEARARRQHGVLELERQLEALELLSGSSFSRAWQMAWGEPPQEGVARLQARLASGDAGLAVEDVTQVAHIEKVVVTDLQEGVVGQPLPQPVAVRVTTATGEPVLGAVVTFKRMGSAQPLFMRVDGVGTPQAQLQALTDENGHAAVRMIPDPIISHESFLRQGTPFAQRLGFNSVMAETTNGTQVFVLAEPFVEVGLPDVPYQLQVPSGNPTSFASEAGLQSVGPLAAKVLDRHGNAWANKQVTWTQAPATGRFFRHQDAVAPQVLDPANPMQLQVLQEWSETDGWMSTGYIPGTDPGWYIVTATVGSLTRQFSVSASVPSTRYAFRTTHNGDFNGVYLTSGPQVLVTRILRWPVDAPGWVPVRGDETGLENVAVTVRTRTQNGSTLDSFQAIPLTTGAEPLDDAISVAFRPKYLVRDGWQEVRFGALAYERRPNGQRVKVCCETETYSWHTSTVPTMQARRTLPGGGVVQANGQALTSDTALGFHVANNSSDSLYVRVVAQPNETGDGILDVSSQPRDSDGDIVLPALPDPNTQRMLPLVAGTQGGRIRFELYAKNYVSSPALKVLQSTAEVELLRPEVDVLVSGLPLRARWVLPAWDFVSAQKPAPGQPPPEDAQAPIAHAAQLGVKVFTKGRLVVRRGDTEVASALVQADAAGITHVTPLGGAPIVLGQGGYVVAEVPPGAVGQETVRVTLAPENPNQPSLTKEVPLTTTVGSVSKLPVGHTFVKGVSVVDGHLVKQAVDVESPSGGLGLAWTRAYATGDSEEGVMGRGWTHAYEGAVLPAGSGFRYVVSGGEGGGQVFTCTGDATGCVPQRGYHGSLRAEGTGASREYIFRAKSGVEYRHGRLDTAVFPARYRLTSIVAPTGRRVFLRYGDASVEGALKRVYDEASGRLLEMGYEREAGRLRMRTVELHQASSPDSTATSFLDVCLRYGYDSQQRLSSVSRYGSVCGSGSPLRTESFSYVDGPSETGRTRLSQYTGPNGEVTRYTYYSSTDAVPGEDDYLFLMNKEERVKSVVEVLESLPVREATTTFTYRIAPEQRTVLGQSLTTYGTTVKGPRTEVPESLYRMLATGSVVETEKPLSAGVVARTAALWNPLHRTREVEEDARGRVTRFTYDAGGNLLARRIEGAALPASGLVAPTLPVADAQGQPVAEVVEKWGYEAGFNALVCHVDAEGYATVSRVDSTGDAPEDVLPLGTGRLLETRHYMAQVPRQVLTSPGTCEEAVSALPQSPQDVVLQWRYCGVEGTACPMQARTGDWVETVGADGHVEKATAYSAHGQVQSKTLQVAETSTVAVQYTYDARGRLEEEQDGLGRHRVQAWDGLDRMIREERRSFEGQGVTRTMDYFPDGQLRAEALEPDFIREHWLDAGGRRIRTLETGGGLSVPLETRYAYDESGNRTSVIDRRGVLTATTYDFADRPVQVTVSVADGPRFISQGGSPDEVGRSHTLSRTAYDATGNKVWAADVSGFERMYQLDSLYRVVEETSPEVPGVTGGSSLLRYTQVSAHDLRGLRVRYVDGNGHASSAAYDLLGRAVVQTDASGRVERRRYDGRGNVTEVRWEAGGAQHRMQSTAYDGLGRVLSVTERVAKESGESIYTSQTVHDDVAHVEWTRNARGFLQARHLDGLGRVFKMVLDAAAGPLSRNPDDGRVGPALNLTSTVEYDRYGQEAARVDALGRRTETVHDALGRLMQVHRPMGVSESQDHDGDGRLIRSVDGRGVERRYTYDALGRPRDEVLVERFSQSNVPLKVAQRAYVDVPDTDALTREEVLDARENLTVRYRDGLGREVRRVDALGQTSEAWFDALHKRQEKDAKNQVTRFTYDAVGRTLSQSEYNTTGGSTPAYTQSWVYADASREQTHLDRRGVPTVLYSDGLGRAVRTLRGQGQDVVEESWVYDAAGQAVRQVDPNGFATVRLFDGAGRLLEETKGAGTTDEATTTFQYDATGKLTQRKGPRATGVVFDARYTYDDLGRRVREEDALGNVTALAYDAVGNKICVMQPLGQPALSHGAAGGLTLEQVESYACEGEYVTRYTYEEENKLLYVTDAAGGLYSFIYDPTRNLVAKQDANGHLTSYEYDARNLRTAEHQHLDAHARLTPVRRSLVPLFEEGATPSGNTGTLTWRYGHDGNGNLTLRVDAKGQRTTHAYDILDRLSSRLYANHTTPRELPSLELENIKYDGNGNVTREAQLKRTVLGLVTEAIVYTHDALDRAKTRRRENDGNQLSFDYDAMGHRTRVVDLDGVETSYVYDALGRVKSATIPSGVVQYSYWPDSLPKGVVWPNGVAEGRCYDAAGRLTQLVVARGTVNDSCVAGGMILSRYAYTYDANGNRLSQVEARTSPATQVLGTAEVTTYGYDVLGRLTGVKAPEGRSTLYRLDVVGNRTGERQAPNGVVEDLGPEAFDLVPDEALTRDVLATFNRADWLRGLEDAKDATRNVTLDYDLVGNLVKKGTASGTRTFAWDIAQTLTAVFNNGVEVGRYEYDINLQRTRRHTAAENVTYTLDGDFVLLEAEGSGASRLTKRRYHYAEGPLAVSEVDSFVTRFLGTDALGSVADAMSTSGDVATARKYDAWGNHRDGSTPASSEFKLGFTGHQYDVETGLTYARARYYDSELGRFISRDSYEGVLGDAPSLHRYAYAHVNPLRYTDPSGHCVNFFAKDVVSWSNCVESGQVLAGYGVGAAKVFGSVGVLTYNATGALLYSTTGGSQYQEQAETFNQGAEGLLHSVRSPGAFIQNSWEGLTGGLAQMGDAIERGDLYGAGEGLGNFTAQVALMHEVGRGASANISRLPARATAGVAVGIGNSGLVLAVTGPTSPALGLAVLANATNGDSGGGKESTVTEAADGPDTTMDLFDRWKRDAELRSEHPNVHRAVDDPARGGSKPELRRIHSDRTYELDAKAKYSLEHWRTRPTDEIVESLKPGPDEELITKPDGRVMNGNTRLKVLLERGYDVQSLPRMVRDWDELKGEDFYYVQE